MYSPLNSYVYIHWILDFKYILLLCGPSCWWHLLCGGTAQRKIFHLVNWSQLIHPGPSSSRSRFFMESSQLCAATLTTGPDYDPLLLLLALAGDVHPNPGPSRYHCSVCYKNVTSQGISYMCIRCSHWVHSRWSGVRNAADYRKANG